MKTTHHVYSFSLKPLCSPILQRRRMATNTALLGLVIGSLPSISDKEATSEKLVSHHLVILIIFTPGPLSSAVHHDCLPWLDWRRHLVGSPWELLSSYFYQSPAILFFISVVNIMTRLFFMATVTSHWIFSEDYPNIVVCSNVHCRLLPACHLTLATGGHCLQSPEGSGQGVLLKGLLQPLRLHQLSLQGLSFFLLHHHGPQACVTSSPRD